MNKTFTGFAIASFLVYGFVLYFMLFNLPGRAMVLVSDGMMENYNYFNSINLIPFMTIIEYITGIGDASIRGHAIRNLGGNLFLLFPMGFYLPFLMDKLKEMKPYLLVVAVFIIIIEATQILTLTGSMDIDDFILNFSGALLGYAFFKHTPFCSIFKYRAW